MKIKNVSFIERHIEKIFISIAIAVLIAVVWFFGLNTPNVAVIGGREMSPGQIDPTIETSANALNQRIASNDIPAELDELEVIDYTSLFFDRVEKKLTPAEESAPLAMVPSLGISNVDPREIRKYVPNVPTPVIAFYEPDLATISDYDATQTKGLGTPADDGQPAFFSGSPFDVSWISLVGHFDLIEMRKELLTPDSDPNLPKEERYQQIDSGWWETQFAITGYRVQRQTARPDGSFAAESDPDYEVVDVPFLPGQPVINLPDEVALLDGTDYLTIIQDNQEQLIRYPFYNLKGRPWEPPTEKTQGLDPSFIQQVSALYQDIVDTGKRAGIYILQRDRTLTPPPAQVERVNNVITDLTNKQREYWKLTGTTVQIDSPHEEVNRDFDLLFIGERDLEERALHEAELAAMEERLATLSTNPNATFIDPGTATKPIEIIGKITIPENGMADIWAHDIYIESGKAYRYRMRVYVTNPLWAKNRSMPEEQAEEYAGRFYLTSDWGPWSEGVSVQPTQYVFLDRAQNSPAPIPGAVTVDVWKYWDGNWRNNEFNINPGDPIGAVAATDGLDVNYYDGAPLVDIEFGYPMDNRQTSRIIYTQNGQILQRIQLLDRTAPMRNYLRTQKSLFINTAANFVPGP
ncbi:MAG: hypothetical protein ACYTGQ_05715 [Planctomycetota bacterium]|jgi:hypothetical protein